MTSRSKTKKGGKASKPIPSNIKQTTLKNFQRLRRLEESNIDGLERCISCNKVLHWKEMQGGHYISRRVEATCIEPDNVWPQCSSCNCYKAGNYANYRINLVRRIGEARVKRLENMMAASQGDEEALESLDPMDRFEVTRKKGKVYWYEKNEEFKRRLKEFE